MLPWPVANPMGDLHDSEADEAHSGLRGELDGEG